MTEIGFSAFVLLFDEHFDRFTEKLFSKIKAMLLRSLVQQFDSPVDHRPANEIIRPPRRGGAGPWGEAEGVGVNEAHTIDDVECLRKLGVGFAGEADDDVGGDRRAIESVMRPDRSCAGNRRANIGGSCDEAGRPIRSVMADENGERLAGGIEGARSGRRSDRRVQDC